MKSFNQLPATEQQYWLKKAVIRLLEKTAKSDEEYITQVIKAVGVDTVTALAEKMYTTPKKTKGADVVSIFKAVANETK